MTELSEAALARIAEAERAPHRERVEASIVAMLREAGIVVICETCDRRMHDRADDYGEGCIGGTIYGFCSSDNCYGLCDSYGYCPCTCHERDALNRYLGQVEGRPSLWH